jgi:hypothetical protein
VSHVMSDISRRIGDAERELQDAERAVGAVVLDGGDGAAASERVSAARAGLERLQAARGELESRQEQGDAAREEQRRAAARYREMAWYREYVQRLEPVLRLREELDAAERHVMELGHVAGVKGVSAIGYQGVKGVTLPPSAVIDGDEERFKRPHRANDALLTIEDCAGWSVRLAPLVDQAAHALDGPEPLPWEGK